MKLKVRRSKDVNIYTRTSLVGLFNLQRYDKLSAALVSYRSTSLKYPSYYTASTLAGLDHPSIGPATQREDDPSCTGKVIIQSHDDCRSLSRQAWLFTQPLGSGYHCIEE